MNICEEKNQELLLLQNYKNKNKNKIRIENYNKNNELYVSKRIRI